MVVQRLDIEVDAAQLADAIDGHRQQILDGYATGLSAAGSALVRDPTALCQALENAQQILTDIIVSVRSGEVQVDERYKLIAWDIGATRAAGGVHPGESMQASSILFQTVMDVVITLLPADKPHTARLFALITLALERSVTLRVREAVASYTSSLLNRVHEAQTGERRRIARELHDRIGHGMSLTQRQLELYSILHDTEPAKAETKVWMAQQAVVDAIHSLRAITSELHAMDPLKSLEKALLNYLDSVDAEEVTIRLRVNGDESWAPPEILDETFLILREAARNSLHHSEGSLLLMNVDITPLDLRAVVEDNGCGFDPGAASTSDGVGVQSMRERAALLNGVLAISSNVGQGAQVKLTIPLTGRSSVRFS